MNKENKDGAFEAFWAAYPKRAGTNPRAPAKQKFDKAVSQGTDPQEIIAGADAYAHDPSLKPGTPYVAQALTWLNQRRWEDYQGLKAQVTARSSQNTGNPIHGLPWGSGTWLLADTPEWQAWREYARRSSPLDRYGGWVFPARWPTGVESSDSRRAATSLTS